MEMASADDRARLSELADRGEIAGPLAHEFNNVLNTVVLQVAILEPEMSPTARADLAVIKRQAETLAELVRLFQRYRKAEPVASSRVDLNHAVRTALEELSLKNSRFQNCVALELQTALPEIAARFSDVERLCRFLIENAFNAAAQSANSIKVRTELDAKGKISLEIEDSGPCFEAGTLDSVFELAPAPRQGTNRLELAACKSIVRRSNGTIRAANHADGGLRICVQWEACGRKT